MNKKGIAVPLVLTIIFGISTLGLGSYVVYDSVKDNNSTVNNQETTTSESTTKTPNQNEPGQPALKEDGKDIVYDLVNEENRKLPYVNINSEYGESINKEIELGKNGRFSTNNSGIERIDYSYSNNNNILSIVIKTYYPSDYVNYEIYNINTLTGQSVSNLEMINLKGFNIEQFNKKAHTTVDSYIEKVTGLPASNDENAISSDVNHFDNPMFFDSNGKLNVIAKIRYQAGGLGLHSEPVVIE